MILNSHYHKVSTGILMHHYQKGYEVSQTSQHQDCQTFHDYQASLQQVILVDENECYIVTKRKMQLGHRVR